MIETTNGAMRDVMRCLFFHGPTWDGNIPSKAGRDALENQGMVRHKQGYAWLTDEGMKLALRMGLDSEKDRWERAKRPSYLNFIMPDNTTGGKGKFRIVS